MRHRTERGDILLKPGQTGLRPRLRLVVVRPNFPKYSFRDSIEPQLVDSPLCLSRTAGFEKSLWQLWVDGLNRSRGRKRASFRP